MERVPMEGSNRPQFRSGTPIVEVVVASAAFPVDIRSMVPLGVRWPGRRPCSPWTNRSVRRFGRPSSLTPPSTKLIVAEFVQAIGPTSLKFAAGVDTVVAPRVHSGALNECRRLTPTSTLPETVTAPPPIVPPFHTSEANVGSRTQQAHARRRAYEQFFEER